MRIKLMVTKWFTPTRKILDHSDIVGNEPIGALAHLRLARSYSFSADATKARTYDQNFLAIWKNADPDVSILKQAKAEYAKLPLLLRNRMRIADRELEEIQRLVYSRRPGPQNRDTGQGGPLMPFYLHQISYTPEALAKLIGNPQDRFEAVRGPIEKLGGKIKDSYFAFGPYDAVLITEMPDNVAAAAIALAFSAGGALRNCQTTALMTNTEALDAMRKAGTCGYKPMTAKAASAK